MRLHELPPGYRGQGVTVAILDAGINTAHPDLKRVICGGQDFSHGSKYGWGDDATGNGTACAGVIAATDNGAGITGIATEAQLQALKLYPGGRTSDLIRALDWCLNHETDLAQINLAYLRPSRLGRLEDARSKCGRGRRHRPHWRHRNNRGLPCRDARHSRGHRACAQRSYLYNPQQPLVNCVQSVHPWLHPHCSRRRFGCTRPRRSDHGRWDLLHSRRRHSVGGRSRHRLIRARARPPPHLARTSPYCHSSTPPPHHLDGQQHSSTRHAPHR
ncbi:hypothetical protein E4K10_46715 [Streptomyces sp. T1317-0309]|nr:hypothetical protein E4K10_46715 [Streptomyces sp. T1317-0309]